MVTRPPVVAGQFYEADPDRLRSRIEWCFTHKLGPGKLPKPSGTRRPESKGFIAPHAGYMFSGPIAAHTYLKIAEEGKPDTFIILGPNHTGTGAPIAVYPDGEWLTPLGKAIVDAELAAEILRRSRVAAPDRSAHESEHSIEVQLPFLQYIFGEVSIVPIAMLYQTPQIAKDLASAMVEAVRELGRDVVVIASTDMSHYEPHELAVRKDRIVLDRIEALDPEGLYDAVLTRGISMCGPGPAMVMLYFSKSLGATKGEVLKYATSGDVTGEKAWVVGYAAARAL